MAKTIIEELVTRLGFDIDDKKLDQFNKKSTQLKNTLKKIALVAVGAATGLTAWVTKIGIATDSLIKFSDSIAISFQSLQELRFAVEREGGSLNSLQTSLRSLSQRASEAFRGIGSGVEIFGLLGIEIRDVNGEIKTSDILIDDLAKSFQRFSKIQQVEFANKLGISPDVLLLLQKGEKNLRQLRQTARDYGLVTEETARNAERFQDSFSDLRSVVRALFTNIAGDLMPVISDLSDRFREWFLTNKELIKQKVGKLVTILGKSVGFLIKHVKVLLALLTAIFALKIAGLIGSFVLAIGSGVIALANFNASLVATNILMGGMPVLIGLIVAGMVALVLVAQDIATFEKGGRSLFGKIIEAADKGEKKFKAIAIILKGWTLGIRIFLKEIELVITAFEKLGNLIDAFKRDSREFQSPLDQRKQMFERDLQNLRKDLGPQSSNTNITAPITITSETGDPLQIANAVSQAISNIARNGINSNPQVIRV